jgi:hypothetical protein
MVNRLVHTAYHEAGHEVLPRVLTLDCGAPRWTAEDKIARKKVKVTNGDPQATI